MPSSKNAASSTNDIIESGAPKGTFGGQIRLRTYSDRTYEWHIFKVILGVAVVLAIAAFIILGFFFPVCNSTQDRGFYSCSCKDGSALDRISGTCICLDTGKVAATDGCPNYATNNTRLIYADARPSQADQDSATGGWTESPSGCN